MSKTLHSNLAGELFRVLSAIPNSRTRGSGARSRAAPALAALFLAHAMTAQASADSGLLGLAGPASGPFAMMLRSMTAGASTGLQKHAGSESDQLRVPLRLAIEDDGCRAEQARGAAEALAALKPALVIGHPCPAAAIAAAPVYAAAGIPFLALGVRHPELTDKRAGPWVFRLAGRDDRQGEAAARALTDAAPGHRIAIVQDRTAYARSVLASTIGSLEALGVNGVAVLPIVAGRRHYDAEIAKLVEMRAEAVLFAGYPSEAAVILRGMRRAGLTGLLLGSDANATADFAIAVRETVGAERVAVLIPAPLYPRGATGDGHTNASGSMTESPQANAATGAVSDLDVLAQSAVDIWLSSRVAPGARADAADGASLGAAIAGRTHLTAALGEINFDAKGDARLQSFAPAPLVDGSWTVAGRPAP